MRITDNTTGVLREVDKRASAGLIEVAKEVKSIAKQDVVVVSGDLRDSITAEVSGNKAIIGSPLNYAPKIEMDKPFLRPALEKARAKIKRVFKI